MPGDFGAHARLMGDLMAMAFQLDLTRVATFMLADAGSNRNYRMIDVPEGHHQLSHHGNDEAKNPGRSPVSTASTSSNSPICSRGSSR